MAFCVLVRRGRTGSWSTPAWLVALSHFFSSIFFLPQRSQKLLLAVEEMLGGRACTISAGVRLLRRLGVEDIVLLARNEWGIKEDLNVKKGKRKLIEQLLEDKQFFGGLTHLHVAQLELRYNQIHSEKRKWRVYRLLRSKDSAKDDQQLNLVVSDLKALEEKLSGELIYFHHHICVQMFDGRIWMRVNLEEGKQDGEPEGSLPAINNVVYFVLHPASATIFASNMKKEHKDYLLHSLVAAFGRYNLLECDLVGHNLQALTELALYQHSQGPYRSYRIRNGAEGTAAKGAKDEGNPLHTHRRKRKRDSLQNGDSAEAQENGRSGHGRLIRTEDTLQDKKAKGEVRQHFGPCEQPALDVVEFRVVDSFRDSKNRQGDRQEPEIECLVKFEGANVLEGIKQMILYGIAEPPLPAHLATIHSAAKNIFSNGPEGNHKPQNGAHTTNRDK